MRRSLMVRLLLQTVQHIGQLRAINRQRMSFVATVESRRGNKSDRSRAVLLGCWLCPSACMWVLQHRCVVPVVPDD